MPNALIYTETTCQGAGNNLQLNWLCMGRSYKPISEPVRQCETNYSEQHTMKLLITLLAAVATATAEENVDKYLVEGNKQFTANMLNEVVNENPGKSVVLSAFSVLAPLAKLGLASEGVSQTEIYNAIGMPNSDVVKAVFPRVNGQLRAVKGVELKMADRLYIKDGYTLNEDFEKISRDVFGADVKNVDFTNTQTAHDINTWVENQTNHKIKDLVAPNQFDAMTEAVLVNAIYFKGSWKDTFDSSLTNNEDFYLSKDKKIQVPMMHNTGNYWYAESQELNAKLIQIPYEGDEASFLVVLPNDIDGLPALVQKLKDPKALDRATNGFATSKVELSLPKFKIETKTNLKNVLEKLNINKLFSPTEANLNYLIKGRGGLYVSEATQKAFIEINEEGAEAAAANVFEVQDRLIIDYDISLIFKADRPFYFQIKTRENVIFSGIQVG